MLDHFETAEIDTDQTSIFARWSGSGPPLLLLHGFGALWFAWLYAERGVIAGPSGRAAGLSPPASR